MEILVWFATAAVAIGNWLKFRHVVRMYEISYIFFFKNRTARTTKSFWSKLQNQSNANNWQIIRLYWKNDFTLKSRFSFSLSRSLQPPINEIMASHTPVMDKKKYAKNRNTQHTSHQIINDIRRRPRNTSNNCLPISMMFSILTNGQSEKKKRRSTKNCTLQHTQNCIFNLISNHKFHLLEYFNWLQKLERVEKHTTNWSMKYAKSHLKTCI